MTKTIKLNSFKIEASNKVITVLLNSYSDQWEKSFGRKDISYSLCLIKESHCLITDDTEIKRIIYQILLRSHCLYRLIEEMTSRGFRYILEIK